MGTNFYFKKYFTRVAKYFVYLIIVFTLVIAIFSLTSGQQGFKYTNLFQPGTGWQIALFLVVMSLIYPLFGFAVKKVYLNKSYEQDKEKIKDVFERNRFKLVCEGKEFVQYRHSSPFLRFMRMFEDTITVNFSDNPIKLEGLRKDVYRISRMIEYAVRDDRNDE